MPDGTISLDTITEGRGMAQSTEGPSGASAAMDCGRYSKPAWRVVVTAPKAEALARDSIQALDVTAFLPMVARPLRRHTVLQPLFPGYLFALIDTADPHYGRIYRSRGVEDLLRSPGSAIPASVPPQAIETLMAYCSARQVVEDDPRPALIAAGVPVRITAGLWAGQTGVCVWSSRQRVQLLLDILGAPLNLPRRAVVEAGGATDGRE